MAGREVREYTNLTDPKDKKWGKGKEKIDDEDITFQRMVAKAEKARCNVVPSASLLLFSLTNEHKAASLADSSPASVPLPLRVEPKPKSGIRQQDLLKKVVEIKPKRLRTSSTSDGNQFSPASSDYGPKNLLPDSDQKGKRQPEADHGEKDWSSTRSNKAEGGDNVENPVRSLLGLAYASSDDED